MARSKEWTDEDREAALSWIERKAKTGAVFRNQDDAADDMLPALADITDLEDFSEAVQAALTTSAWKRLLGALRQRKHQADDEDQDEGPTDKGRQAGACPSCARLQDEVDRLQQRETANVAWREAVMGAVQGNPQRLAAMLRPMLAGTLQAFIEALQAPGMTDAELLEILRQARAEQRQSEAT